MLTSSLTMLPFTIFHLTAKTHSAYFSSEPPWCIIVLAYGETPRSARVNSKKVQRSNSTALFEAIPVNNKAVCICYKHPRLRLLVGLPLCFPRANWINSWQGGPLNICSALGLCCPALCGARPTFVLLSWRDKHKFDVQIEKFGNDNEY